MLQRDSFLHMMPPVVILVYIIYFEYDISKMTVLARKKT